MTLLDLPDVTFEDSTDHPFGEELDVLVATDLDATDLVATDLDATDLVATDLDATDLDATGFADTGSIEESPTGSSYARCADGNGTLTHLFFSDDEFDVARAKAICARCGLAAGCLAGALERAEAYGVWGGQLLVDGAIVAVKRGRGRPPKTPRQPLVVDEVPLPPHLVA